MGLWATKYGGGLNTRCLQLFRRPTRPEYIGSTTARSTAGCLVSMEEPGMGH